MKSITLRNGEQTIVDDDDYEYLSQFKWRLDNYGYARRGRRINKKYSLIYIHRLVNKTPEGFMTDHINRDKLDNRKTNLRSVSNSINQYNTALRPLNTSGLKRLFWNKNSKRWIARIRRNNGSVRKILYQECFKDKDQAIDALLAAEKIHLPEEFWQTKPELVC